MSRIKKSWSLITFILLSLWLIGFRSNNIIENEISWDVFGYYLPLQATFIADDPLLNEVDWVEKLNEEHNLSGTLYQISSTPDEKPMYFFLFGMSYMYLVFFAIGHVLAGWFGFVQNGLSPPYQYALVYGCIIYTIIGLYYFRKIMAHFFSDKIVAILLVLCVLGTNYSHHMTLKNLETVNVLFMFTAIILWNTIRWYDEHKFNNLLAIGVSICLMALAKPSEVLIVILPVLWGLSSRKELKGRLMLFWNYRRQFIWTIIICLLIATPQMAYWYTKTGRIIYDTYKNPGVGLDLFAPHIFDSLFSYRKGWLLYTPIMIFSLLGFYVLYKKKREYFLPILIQFLVSFYIIASWTEFWYGAGFSNRPIIAIYPILFIPLGYFLVWLSLQKALFKGVVGVGIVFFVFLNQFQWWQLRNYILDPYRTTKEYYWSTFLSTTVNETQRELLLVKRDFSGTQKMERPQEYKHRTIHFFRKVDGKDETNSFPLHAFVKKIPYKSLTPKDHCWVHFSFDYLVPKSEKGQLRFAVTMDRKNGDYGDVYYDLTNKDSVWQKFDTLYLTPEIRNVNDDLKYFFWNEKGIPFDAKNFKVKVYQKK